MIAQVSDQPGTGPLVLVGHSLGAAVALAAPVAAVDALVIIDPAGLIRLRVPTAVLATTIRWLMRPDDQRSHALLHHLSTSNAEHERLAEWLTLVAQHTRAVGAPGPLPRAVLTPWTRTPRSILSGQHDCFLPLGKLAAAAKQQLDTDVTVIPHAAHLAVHDDPHSIASAVTNHLTRTTPWPGEPDPGSA